MNETIKQQILFVLEDDNEVMQTALDKDSGLDDENKRMNRELIREHERIIGKVERNELLSQHDLQLIRDANEIHINDTENLNGRHHEALELNEWLDRRVELSMREAMEILEQYLDADSHTPAKVYRALHTLWEEATPNGMVTENEPAFDDAGRCLACSSRVSFADVTDTVVLVGDEIVKRYDGDITNRNCVKCTYPQQYDEYANYDKEERAVCAAGRGD